MLYCKFIYFSSSSSSVLDISMYFLLWRRHHLLDISNVWSCSSKALSLLSSQNELLSTNQFQVELLHLHEHNSQGFLMPLEWNSTPHHGCSGCSWQLLWLPPHFPLSSVLLWTVGNPVGGEGGLPTVPGSLTSGVVCYWVVLARIRRGKGGAIASYPRNPSLCPSQLLLWES